MPTSGWEPINPNSVGIRVPENELALELLKQTGPLAVTSANISGSTGRQIITLKLKIYLVIPFQPIWKVMQLTGMVQQL
ncbi:MAG: Sua5/YciO/YrdC/YwlC family protein [Candidatus Actinomarina sp.]